MSSSNYDKDIIYSAVSTTDKVVLESYEHPTWMIWKRRRYVVAVLSLLGFVNCYLLRVNVSIGVVAMTENRTVQHRNGNITYVQDFSWDSKMQGYLLSSFFYGYTSTQLLGGWLAARFGGKRVFGIGIGVTAVLTLLTPGAAHLSFYLLLAVRVAEGIFEGVTFTSVQALLAYWAPPLERTKLISIAFSGAYVGAVIAMPLCAHLSTKLGWESIFYFSGTLGLLWFAVWWIFISDTPNQDRFISSAELEYIQTSLSIKGHRTVVHPWRSIITSVPALACIVAQICENWGGFTMLTQLPTFMRDVLDFELGRTGIILTLPYLAISISLIVSGYLADYLRSNKILTDTNVRKIFCCGAFICQAIFLMVAVYLPSAVGTIICITIAVGLGGFATSGFCTNYLDIAPLHASVVMGIGNTFGTIPGIISPTITGHIVQTASVQEWRIVFFIASGIYLIGAILYGFMASGELQPWASGYQQSKSQNVES